MGTNKMNIPLGTNISGSVAAIIMQVSRWQELFPKWLEHMESRDPGFCKRNNYTLPVKEVEPEQQFTFYLGHCFEPSIIEFAEREQKSNSFIGIRDREKAYALRIGADEHAITCHVDGEYRFIKENGILHEGKTVNQNLAWKEYKQATEETPARVPMDNLIQCEHNMICTGLKKAILSSLVLPFRQIDLYNQGWRVKRALFGGTYYIEKESGEHINPSHWAETWYQTGNFHQYEIESNSDLQSVMMERYHHYWNHNVINGHPPKIEDWDTVLKYPIPDRFGYVEISEELLELAREIPSHNEQISESKKRISFIKAQFANTAIKRNWMVNKSKKERQKKIDGLRIEIKEQINTVRYAEKFYEGIERKRIIRECLELIGKFWKEYRELVKTPVKDKIEIDKKTKDKIIFTNPLNGEQVASWSNTLRLSSKI
jgi:hypothetical protein